MFRLRGFYPLRLAFRMPFDYIDDFLLPAGSADPAERSHNPDHATPAGYHT
jgi:hypothetical protein